MSDEDDIKKLVQAQKDRSLKTKMSRSFLIAPHLDSIKTMIGLNISLPLIKGWLDDKHKVVITLQTLRSFVVRTLGEDVYEDYCKRNGWAKTKKVVKDENKGRRIVDSNINTKFENTKDDKETTIQNNSLSTDSVETGMKRPTPVLIVEKGVWGQLKPSPVNGTVDLKQK